MAAMHRLWSKPLPLTSFLVTLAALAGTLGRVQADVWSFTDTNEVLHFTNIRPKGPEASKWRLVQRDGPASGKVVARRGELKVSKQAGVGRAKRTQNTANHRGDCERCDRVPARDRSPDRFHRYDQFIVDAASLYQIPVPLIRAVIKVESDYDPRVVSAFGARGLMQLMPAVVKDMGVRDVHDPRQNILGGTRLLRILANRYDGDLSLTIAGYHAGVGSLAKYNNTIPPYKHTRKYLGMVLDRYRQYVAAAHKRRQLP